MSIKSCSWLCYRLGAADVHCSLTDSSHLSAFICFNYMALGMALNCLRFTLLALACYTVPHFLPTLRLCALHRMRLLACPSAWLTVLCVHVVCVWGVFTYS